jgi:hypothetical protein
MKITNFMRFVHSHTLETTAGDVDQLDIQVGDSIVINFPGTRASELRISKDENGVVHVRYFVRNKLFGFFSFIPDLDVIDWDGEQR